MINPRSLGAFLCRTASAAALVAAIAPAASAQTFELVYTGTFSSADALNLAAGPTSDFTSATPFLITAFFNENSPNLAAPVGVPGFVDYAPTSATLTVGRDTYNFATYDQNPLQGVTVAIFDGTTPFGAPGHYAIGLLQNPLADGAGIIGDWSSASPAFSAAHLTPTVFTGYTGVGYGSGPAPGGPGTPATVVPIPLTDAFGQSYLLTLGNYDENAAQGSVQNTAELLPAAVPEASSVVSMGLLLMLGLGGLAIAAKRRKASVQSQRLSQADVPARAVPGLALPASGILR